MEMILPLIVSIMFILVPLRILSLVNMHKRGRGRPKQKRYVMLEQVEYVGNNAGEFGIHGRVEMTFIDLETQKYFELKRTQFARIKVKVQRPHVYLVTFRGPYLINMKLMYESIEDFSNNLQIKNPPELVDTPKDRFRRQLVRIFVYIFIIFSQGLLYTSNLSIINLIALLSRLI